jgi:hypothetical protein
VAFYVTKWTKCTTHDTGPTCGTFKTTYVRSSIFMWNIIIHQLHLLNGCLYNEPGACLVSWLHRNILQLELSLTLRLMRYFAARVTGRTRHFLYFQYRNLAEMPLNVWKHFGMFPVAPVCHFFCLFHIPCSSDTRTFLFRLPSIVSIHDDRVTESLRNPRMKLRTTLLITREHFIVFSSRKYFKSYICISGV